MKKLLGIVVLGLLCCNIGYSEIRNDEYSCMYDDKSGTEPMSITKDEIVWKSFDNPFSAPIKKETKKIIYAVIDEGKDYEVNLTFYKKTKKLKLVYSSGSEYNFDCTLSY